MNEQSLTFLLKQKSIQTLFKVFEKESKEICLVGGCVRDALLGNISLDIDIAANVKPNEIIQILEKNDLLYEDYAYKYGSVTTFIEGQKFQFTSLREDINQKGRNTSIIFTDDWKKDASRRDFTINAMYLFPNGELKDFLNGKEDLRNRTLRFIEKIEDSIQQDFLRIFRYYRFLGLFENPELVQEYDEILVRYFENSLNHLSNDIIRREILKMFKMPFPVNCFFYKKNIIRKKNWIDLVKEHFIKTSYDIGLNKCLNKIDLLVN